MAAGRRGYRSTSRCARVSMSFGGRCRVLALLPYRKVDTFATRVLVGGRGWLEGRQAGEGNFLE